MSIQDEIPKSRITLKYRTEITGEPEDITLPMRFLLLGDFSQGTSKDRKVDLDERRTRNLNGKNINEVMNDMEMVLNFTVENKIDPANGDEFDVSLPFNNLHSMQPDKIAETVPKIKGMLMVKTLLQELVANVDNRKSFRVLLNKLMGNEEALKKMIEDLKGFESFKLPVEAKAAEGDEAPAEAPAEA